MVARDAWDWWFGGGDDDDQTPPSWWDREADITQNCTTGRLALAHLDELIKETDGQIEAAGCEDLIVVGPMGNAGGTVTDTRENLCRSLNTLLATYQLRRDEEGRYVREHCRVRI